MAWRCSGATNTELVQNLWQAGLIRSARVRDAMLSVDRADYAPPPCSAAGGTSAAYDDAPAGIGHGATISAPHMHAAACEALLPRLQPGARVLDVGCGSGYLTHVLAELVRPAGTVVGVDHIPALVRLSRANTVKSSRGKGLVETGAIRYVVGDGREGWRGGGGGGSSSSSSSTGEGDAEGFDAIHVGAATDGWRDTQLIHQLRCPGRLFVPVREEDGAQYIWLVDKDEKGEVTKQRMMGVRYVPLTDAPAS